MAFWKQTHKQTKRPSIGYLVSSRSYYKIKPSFSMWKLKLPVCALKIIITYCSWLGKLLRHFSRSRKGLSGSYQGAFLWRSVTVFIGIWPCNSTSWGRSFAGKDLDILVVQKLNLSSSVPLLQRTATTYWSIWGRVQSAGQEKVPLFGTCESTSVVLYPVLGSPLQEWYWQTGSGPMEYQQEGHGDRAHDVWGKAKRAGLV